MLGRLVDHIRALDRQLAEADSAPEQEAA